MRTQTLSDMMEFDHVIEVHEDGSITEPKDVWAPEVYINGGEDIKVNVSDGWTLLRGHFGTDPIRHPSEFIGGRLEDDIRSTPGVYVAVVVTDRSADTDSGEDDVAGWAVARQH